MVLEPKVEQFKRPTAPPVNRAIRDVSWNGNIASWRNHDFRPEQVRKIIKFGNGEVGALLTLLEEVGSAGDRQLRL